MTRRLGVLAITAVLATLVGWAHPPAVAAAPASVSAGHGVLNVRSGPGTDHPVVRQLPDGTALRVVCQAAGERVAGTERTTAAWNRTGDDRYVSDAYVAWHPERPVVPWCGGTPAVHTGSGTYLNVRENTSTRNSPTGRLPDGGAVRARCQLGGERIAGSRRTTAMWLRVDGGRYVSDAYVRWRPRRPALTWCDQPADPAPRGHRRFVEWAAEHARTSRDRYDVPVSVTIAQAINESGWGRSALTTQGNAYFGIKCFGTPGPVAVGCRPYDTTECGRGGCFATSDTFRVYPSAARSFADHGRFLSVNPRYDPAFAHTGNPDRFAREIHKAGYATDPDYSDQLIDLMREYDLYQYD